MDSSVGLTAHLLNAARPIHFVAVVFLEKLKKRLGLVAKFENEGSYREWRPQTVRANRRSEFS
jgi:hypothetical protein